MSTNREVTAILAIALILSSIILSVNFIRYKIIFYKTLREINKISEEDFFSRLGSDYLVFYRPKKRGDLILLSDYKLGIDNDGK